MRLIQKVTGSVHLTSKFTPYLGEKGEEGGKTDFLFHSLEIKGKSGILRIK